MQPHRFFLFNLPTLFGILSQKDLLMELIYFTITTATLYSVPECSSLQLSNGSVEYKNLSLVGEGTNIMYLSEGANATYNCNPGFLLVGDKVRHCMNTGLWSPGPTCKGIILLYLC